MFWRGVRLEGVLPAESGPTSGLALVVELRGGGKFEMGWGALWWQETLNTDEVRFGRHRQIKYLAKKVANFLHQYHSELFPGMNLPLLPSDQSSVDVHAMLTPWHIGSLLRRLKVPVICNVK